MSNSEYLAVMKLVQMVTHDDQFERIGPEQWMSYCRVSFGWNDATAIHIMNNLRKTATRELKNAELEL